MQKKNGIWLNFFWDDCIPHSFGSYIYLSKNYDVISSPHLNFQKANEIVSAFFLEDSNRINILKFKIKEKFELIHHVYTLLFSKIYSRKNSFGIQKKNSFDYHFQTWKKRKITGAVGPKNLKQLPQSTANLITTKVLSNAKDPSIYQKIAVHKNKKKPIDFKIDDDERPAMVKPNVAAQTKELRKEKYQKNNQMKIL